LKQRFQQHHGGEEQAVDFWLIQTPNKLKRTVSGWCHKKRLFLAVQPEKSQQKEYGWLSLKVGWQFVPNCCQLDALFSMHRSEHSLGHPTINNIVELVSYQLRASAAAQRPIRIVELC
jgi:hypothetical protein